MNIQNQLKIDCFYEIPKVSIVILKIFRKKTSADGHTRNLFIVTKWSRVLLEKLIAAQLGNNFLAVYGIRSFVIMFTGYRPSFLS
jgi:hypothetical protein